MAGFKLQVTCDDCGHRFKPSVQQVPTSDGGERVFFLCPECDHEYIVAIANKIAVRARESARKVRGILRDLKNQPHSQSVIQRRQTLLLELEGLKGTIDANMIVTEPG